MFLLLDIFGFLSVLLRGLILTSQSITLGGIAFLALLALPLHKKLGDDGDSLLKRSARILSFSALFLCLVTLTALIVNCLVLIGTLDLSWPQALGAGFAHVDIVVTACSLLIALLAYNQDSHRTIVWLVILGITLLAAQVSATHAVSRLESRWPLIAADFLHMLGAAIWIGGLPYFWVALNLVKDGAQWRLVGRRYSLMSMSSVAAIIIGGLTMAFVYVGSISAIYGTAYGVMTSTKVMLLMGLLLLGGMNYLTVESLRRDAKTPVLRLKRFAEVEIGIGLTVLFAAASLTSLPPGNDLTQDRATRAEIIERLTPQWPPRLTSPDHDTLAIPMLEAKIAASEQHETTLKSFVPGEGLLPPRNAADIAWSEYNHHWAGIFVGLIGFMALMEHFRLGRIARHWPLLFIAMAGFLFFRSDPEVWPMGDIGFFTSLRDPEVVQHRVFVFMICLFGLFEWRVRLGKMKTQKAALVFPLITALGGMMLLTHSHAIANLKDQLLIEMSHVPLALAGITAGWARWLELRMDGRPSRIASLTWPIAFVVVGFILLSYREA